MSSGRYNFYGWAMFALAVVSSLGGSSDAKVAALALMALVMFVAHDILKALGK